MRQRHEQLESLAKLFEHAEKQVKKAEDVNGSIVVPSINELRYFGYHIVKALLAEDDETTLAKEIEKAAGHAKRAIYDASEALIIYYLEKAESFQERHANSDSITEILPNYVEYLKKLAQINKKIAFIRDDGEAYKYRDRYYQKTLPYIDELNEIVSTFDEANHLIVKKDRKKARNFILVFLTLVATVLGLALSLS